MSNPSDSATHAELMDRMYRYQRYFYDVTRKYYLLGRDQLLARMDLRPGQRVLEDGCGTGRNLLKLAGLRPEVELYGLDISRQMLDTAAAKFAGTRHAGRVHWACCGADELDYRRTFGLERPFDAIFFSFSLSMIPPWRESLLAAAASLQPDGSIYIVDFWDQADLPAWFRKVLQTWLSWFHVRHEPKLIACLEKLARLNLAKVELTSLYGRYSYIARLSELRPVEELRAAVMAGE